MAKKAQNVEWWTGDARDLLVTVYDSAGASKDITGATATYAVRDVPGGSLLFAAKTTSIGMGIVLTNAGAGILTISIVSSDTANVIVPPEGTQDYYHELEIVLGAYTITGFTGRFRLHKSVAGAGS